MMSNQAKQISSSTTNGHQGIKTVGPSSNLGLMNNFSSPYGNMSSVPAAMPLNVNMSTMSSPGNMFQSMGGMNWNNQIPPQNMMSMTQQQQTNQIAQQTSMNSFGSMMTPMRPMNMNSAPMGSANKSVKPLSSSDINDLLS